MASWSLKRSVDFCCREIATIKIFHIFLRCASSAWTQDVSNNMWTSQELHFHFQGF